MSSPHNTIFGEIQVPRCDAKDCNALAVYEFTDNIPKFGTTTLGYCCGDHFTVVKKLIKDFKEKRSMMKRNKDD